MTRKAAIAVAIALLAPVLAGCMGENDVPSEDPVEYAEPDESQGFDPDSELPPMPEPPANGTWDVHVTVRAASGPHGAAEPVEIDRRFYSMNVADWDTEDYFPEPDPTYVAYLKALQPGLLRWPAGHTSQEREWDRDSDAHPASTSKLTPEHVDAFIALCEAVGAEPLLAVNQKTGTPAEAADFVRYVNVEKGYDVTWWQIGNEPDHRDGLTSGPEEYAEDYLEIAEAMRAVDPSIKIVGGEIMTGAHILGSSGKEDWMTPILEIAGSEMDAISWHYYPLDSGQKSEKSSAYPTLEHLFQEEASDWPPAGLGFAAEIFPQLREARDEYAPGAEIWVTEMAEDSGDGGAPGLVDTHAGALWAADVLGRFAEQGPGAVVKFVFKSGSSHRYNLIDDEYNPRPEYSTYWLYANHFGNRVVDAQSDDIEDVAAHAALTEGDTLTIVLVNKQTEARDVRLTLPDFLPASAEGYVLEGESYDAKEVTINGEALGLENLDGIPSQPMDVERDGVMTLPPLSVTLLKVHHA